MYLSSLLVGALLPLGLIASPTTPEGAEVDTRAISRPQHCAIVGNSATVKCRTGPATKYDVKTTLRKGTAYDFWCVFKKECITINGSTNCGWHYIPALKCYVNGHYTSSACTLARLGSCAGNDDNNNADPW
ncbi:hypothetical protein B0T16DRAFT_450626 [Cercophora newfieldiana]|uniref:Uncharacterized protein n=1 Tax=Cercophora newfieldiana TaxID=92897 RepID=A0AA39YLN2_9PEZI|nr:hypothetical protein B0T16DRAFT_450626 [Cercophora newfieldiana]